MTRRRNAAGRMLAALALSLTLAVAAAVPAGAATFIINNTDPPGFGFNDPTPVAPVGGNPGVTLGEQRLNVFQFAADLWGAVLDSPVTIVIQGTFFPAGTFFGPLPCTPTSAVLGAAGTIQIFANFAGAGFADTWYHSALANALGGVDLTPGPPDPGFFAPPFNDDIVSLFNDRLDSDPACLGGIGWYYGFDNNSGGGIDLLNVVMHEYAHGLGFSNFINEASGLGPAPPPLDKDIYSRFTLDLTTGKHWDAMTAAERVASAINTFNVVWDGPAVTAAAPLVLGPRPSVRVLRPKGIVGSYEAQTASFGPPLNPGGGTSGQVVLADDGSGAPNDGCEPILNNVHGKIALVDRGACSFVQKVFNAQVAGAKGVMVANNLAKGLPPMGGSSPLITIPSVGITRDDGDLIKAQLPGVNVKLIFDGDFLAGTTAGLVRLYAPDPVALGSSISHWDTTASPNLLMEPFITSTLEAATDVDLTPLLFLDEGWGLLP